MTFVKTRLLIEKMSAGENAAVLLRGEEPTINVPASIVELGHTVLSDETIAAPLDGHGAAGDVLLKFRKNR